MILSGVHSDLSDDELDALYASTYRSYKAAKGMSRVTWATALQPLNMEILERLRTPWAFVTGYFDATKFPQYDAIQAADPSMGGFRQSSEAQQSIHDSAGRIDVGVESFGKNIGFGLGTAALLGAAALGTIVYIKLK